MPSSLSIHSSQYEVQNQPYQIDLSLSHEAKHHHLMHLSHNIYVTTSRQHNLLDH